MLRRFLENCETYLNKNFNQDWDSILIADEGVIRVKNAYNAIGECLHFYLEGNLRISIQEKNGIIYDIGFYEDGGTNKVYFLTDLEDFIILYEQREVI